MNDANTQALLSALRSLLMVIGSALAAHGLIGADAVNEAVGAIMVIAPFIWGIWEKYRAEAKAKDREVVAVNAGISAATTPGTVSTPVAAPEAKQIIEAFSPPTTKGTP